ncbi:carboxypeptidase-like regulatory domain-containing protein [Solirubrobacter phytolaccae]|uniref:Carboxypeptidase-like regulatory domain-containing protein n=1 Tax=Solirubrobacter phytolaccae TaxID=1404360 RepID=A0A9X3SC21_9ACTN|nr:carboxypeptidase-like regulatory domain-containing protein [Solirubrobacter phytolaccae]MDA0182030.1 carboxypeptidase-like regulatory domain-containing protein [Solirubrobacter phytolaccae]
MALLLVAPAAARAGTYTIDSCTNGSTSGWSPFYAGAYSGWGNSCGPAGGAMNAAISNRPGSTAGWTFTAPAHTDIAGFRLSRSYTLAANQAFGTSVVTTQTGPSQAFYDSRPNYGGVVGGGPELQAAGGMRGETTLTAKLDCGGGLACTGNSVLQVHGVSIDLRDDSPPVVSSVSGSLLATGSVHGARVVSYSAQDQGGGVRREQLLVDGAVVAERAAECSFALTVPCPLGASGTLAVDTTRLAEGAHEALLVVTDATLTGRGTHGPLRFVVDNVPPPSSTSAPRVFGTSTLYADDGAWNGTNLVYARRWQRLEDGVWSDIPGADQLVYTPTLADAGLRLRFKVRASNAEGSAEAFSEPTPRLPGPPGPTSTPTPTASPTATPTPSPAPVIVAGAPAPPPLPVAVESRLSAAFGSGRAVVTVRWGERRKVTGTLTRADGRPLVGEAVTVTSRMRATGAVSVGVGRAVTDAAGRFSFLPAAGASRVLTFAHGGRTVSLTVHVVPRITIKVARSGRIDGRVSGAPPGISKLVQLQALHGRVWRTFATTRLQPTGGRFSHRPRTAARRVRVRVAAEPGWPFVTGTSAAARRR